MHTPSPPHNALLSLTPLPPPPRSTLFPYTTLFRSLRDDADDLRHNVTLLIIAGVDAEAFADWIFTGKVLLGHSLVDNHNARRVRSEERRVGKEWRLRRSGDELGRRKRDEYHRAYLS